MQKRNTLKNFFLITNLLFLSSFFSSPLSAQGYTQKAYTHSNIHNYIGKKCTPDHNGGMLMSGMQSLSPSLSLKFILDYVDKNGNLQWSFSLPDLFFNDYVICAQNGDFLLCALTSSLGGPQATIYDENIFLARISPSGQLLWSHAYGNQYDEEVSGFWELPNGTLEVIGLTNDNTAGGAKSCCRLRISANGVLQQTDLAAALPAYYYYTNAIRDTVTGNYLLWTVGEVALADANFQLLWKKHYVAGTGALSILSAKISATGEIALAGSVALSNSHSEGMMMYLDPGGNLLASARYPKGANCSVNDVVFLPSGRLAFACASDGFSPYTYNNQYQEKGIAFTTDLSGHVIRAVSFSQELYSEAKSISYINDSTIVLNGSYGVYDVKDACFFLKTDTALWSPQYCSEPVSLADSSFALTVSPVTNTLSYSQIALGDSVVTPLVINLQPQEIALCPTKSIERDRAESFSRAVIATHDGNVVICSSSFLSYLPYITKYTPEGKVIWSHPVRFSSLSALEQAPYCIYETPDHGFVMGGGGDDDASNGSGDLYLMRLDSMGTPAWVNSSFNISTQISYINRIKRNPDGSTIAMAAVNVSSNTLNSRFALVKFDSLGNRLWSKIYENSYGRSGDVISVPGAYIACAFEQSASRIFKCDTAGNVIWSKEISSGGNLWLNSIATASNHDFIVAGCISNTPSQIMQPLVMRFDSSGTLLWSKQFAVPATQFGRVLAITNLPGDHFLLSTFASNSSVQQAQGYVSKMNGNGSMQWSTLLNYDSLGGLWLEDAAVLRDLSVIPAASIFNANESYSRFEKLSPGGTGPCNASAASLFITNSMGITLAPSNLLAINLNLTDDAGPFLPGADSTFSFFKCSLPDTTFYSTTNPADVIELLAAQQATELNLYPNPSSGLVHIRSVQSGIKQTDVFSNTGQLLLSQRNESPAREEELQLNNLPAGCYFVRVLMENNTIENLRCIKVAE